MVIRERALEISRVAENPGGYCQGVGGGVQLPGGINTPGVEELPVGDENSGVTPKGDRVPGADGQERGGDGNLSATRDTEASGDSRSSDEMAIRLGPAVAQRPQRGTAEGGSS